MTMSGPVKIFSESALAGEAASAGKAHASATELEVRRAGAVKDVDGSEGG